MAPVHRIRESDLVTDLSEDLQTRWVPDVIADVDLAESVKVPRLTKDDVQFIDVPRVDGGYRTAPVLNGAGLAALRDAVEPLRTVSDQILDPAVCGYRNGAEGSTTYSDEYRRFRSWAEAFSETSAFVVIADVHNFFGSVSAFTLKRAFDGRLSGSWTSLHEHLEALRSAGVQGLPAGYGDARLIANGILAAVDSDVRVPYTRWVDDYRIFAGSKAQADAVVCDLRASLGRIGLRLNESKLAILDAADYRKRRHGVLLDSVYHPQDEDMAVVRAGLRAVFFRAIADSDRRQLRFALPRLGEQGDPVALEFALHALAHNNIDAPRLAAYVGGFLEDGATRQSLNAIARRSDVSEWTLLRLVPLLCRIPLSKDTLDALAARAFDSRSRLVRSAVIRVLALHAREEMLDMALECRTFADPRALLAACLDLDRSVPEWLREAAPATSRSLASGTRAPLPVVASLL